MSEQQDLNEEQFSDLNEIEAEEQKVEAKQAEADAKAAQADDEEIEPRYRGKSILDIMKMHKESEKLIARQAQEVGEVRRLADELIKSQLTRKTEEEKPKVDFFDNPEEAIRQAIESSPDLKQAKELAMVSRQRLIEQQVLERHPEARELVKSSDFVDWVRASKVRTELAGRAENYDFDAADELFSTYKALRKPEKREVDPAEKASRQDAMRKASVDTGGSGESTKKIYRRSDIIQLQIRNPSKFAAMQDEILAAYAEGRVR